MENFIGKSRKLTYLNEDGTLDTKYENFPGIDYSEYWDAKIKELQ